MSAHEALVDIKSVVEGLAKSQQGAETTYDTDCIDDSGSNDGSSLPDSGGSSHIPFSDEKVGVIGVSKYKDSQGNIITAGCRPRFPRRTNRPILCDILELPSELQYQILSHFDFGDIERLRRTCHYIRWQIPKPTIKRLFPDIKEALLDTCSGCLQYFPGGSGLVTADENDDQYPFSSRCFSCTAQRGGFVVGRKYIVSRKHAVWICRWCGYPAETTAWDQPEFHKTCYRVYNQVMFRYFVLGLAQSVVIVVGSLLCWRLPNKDSKVTGPTAINFILGFGGSLFALLRGSSVRTYHWAALVEAIILGLWIMPLQSVARHFHSGTGRQFLSTAITAIFIRLNMVFRLLNMLGNVVLMCEYKLWRQRRPCASQFSRLMHALARLLIYWAYPQCVNQDYPPIWWPLSFENGRVSGQV